jgi:hypothetical protein
MTNRSRRLLKKMHKNWLELAIIDLSQVSYWRKRVFESSPNQVFAISADDTRGLRKNGVTAIHRYKLHYCVRIVEMAEAGSWLNDSGLVIFKFWATDFPTVRAYSGNNPAVI